jgi:hypothetical protein
MRVTALSLLMLFSIAALLPLISSSAHSNKPTAASTKKKFRRYSRAWWRRYRQRQRRRRAALQRRKALAGLHKAKPSERQSTRDSSAAPDALLAPLSNMMWLGNDSQRQSTPDIATEHGSSPTSSVVEKGVRLNTPDGQTVGKVAVAVVANAVGGGTVAATPAARRRALSGVPFAELRRMVIDKMIASGGWVVNDFEREIGGRRVYVVLAQTAAPNDRRVPQQSWTFYFTEADGRIYNIVSNAPLEFSDRMALEAERVIAMLGTPAQQANPSAARR